MPCGRRRKCWNGCAQKVEAGLLRGYDVGAKQALDAIK
jgi:hypothetical protein